MTIKEIAQLAQVSSAAVSRYMNGGYVSEEKKRTDSGSDRRNRVSTICTGTDTSHEAGMSDWCDRA